MAKWLIRFGTLIAGIGLAVPQIHAADPDAGFGEGLPAHLSLRSHFTVSHHPTDNLWDGDIGDGFLCGASEVGVGVGAGFGMRVFGTVEAHDVIVGMVDYGWMFTGVMFEDTWVRGNFEVVAEAFGGAQYRPRHAWLGGVVPLLRYNFATHSRWVPFVNLGAGAGGTGIGLPDLGSTFEFNLQGGAGVHYFWSRNSAITVQYRYLHMSNAGLSEPNLGVNISMICAGVSWFF